MTPVTTRNTLCTMSNIQHTIIPNMATRILGQLMDKNVPRITTTSLTIMRTPVGKNYSKLLLKLSKLLLQQPGMFVKRGTRMVVITNKEQVPTATSFVLTSPATAEWG